MSKSKEASSFYTLLLPAIISQSLIMGGGYSTGREITQYAGRFGPQGWLAVGVIFVGFSVLSALAFELARVGKAYDYKSWVKLLIGPLWPLFDIVAVAMLLLIIAVMAAAIGSVLRQTLGLPDLVGLALAFTFVAFLSWKGEKVMERFKTVGSVALYLGYLAFSIYVLRAPLPEVPPPEAPVPVGQVLVSAIQYVGYNLATFTAVLFCLHRQTTRRQAFTSGALSGFAMTVPFALTLLCILRFWPDPAVLDAEVPWLEMLRHASGSGPAGALWAGAFGVVAGWTLLETAVGGIHALVDRLDRNIGDLPRFLRPEAGRLGDGARVGLSVGVLAVAMLLSRIGIIDLVAKGYGMLAWAFIVLLAVPLLTVGVWRIFFRQQSAN